MTGVRLLTKTIQVIIIAINIFDITQTPTILKLFYATTPSLLSFGNFLFLATLTLCLSLTSEVQRMVSVQNVCSQLLMPWKYCEHKPLQVVKELYVMIRSPRESGSVVGWGSGPSKSIWLPGSAKGVPRSAPLHGCLRDASFVLRPYALFKTMLKFLFCTPIDLNCVSPFLHSTHTIYSHLPEVPPRFCPSPLHLFLSLMARVVACVQLRCLPAFLLRWFGEWKTTEMSLRSHKRRSLQSWVMCHDDIFFI